MHDALSRISFVLVQPQMGENIGATARAMGNFGLTDLRLVAPRDGWPNPAAQTMSSGAFAHMQPVQIFQTLSEALADTTQAYATTARPRDMAKPVLPPRKAVAEALSTGLTHTHSSDRIAFVFGSERCGLSNENIALCHTIVQADTTPDFSSLNLGQCALMIAYELFVQVTERASDGQLTNEIDPAYLPASHADFGILFDRLEGALEAGGFFRDDGLRPKITRTIRTMLMRAKLTPTELKTFHGMIRALINPR